MPSVPDILQPEHREHAVTLLRQYFGADEGSAFTGSQFERLGGGGDAPAVANEVTAEDIVALSMLSIRIPGRAARRLLEDADFAAKTNEHLRQLPGDCDMVDVDAEVLAPDGPAYSLWKHFRQVEDFGPTTTSKLMARKRPRLIPVWDSVIERAFGFKGSADQWAFWREMLAADGGRVHNHVLELRREAGFIDDISALRVLDVVVWMAHRQGADGVDEAAKLP